MQSVHHDDLEEAHGDGCDGCTLCYDVAGLAYNANVAAQLLICSLVERRDGNERYARDLERRADEEEALEEQESRDAGDGPEEPAVVQARPAR